MPENVHIPLGKVQAAYDLTDEELYNLIQKLWERKQLLYKELWAETYEKYWHFAATGSLPYTQEKLPELPEPDSRHQSNFYPLFYGTQMVRYLTQLINLVSYKPFRMGLDYLFETAFEEGHSVAAEERDILYKYFEFTELDRKPPRKDYYRHFKAGPRYLISFISRNMAGTLMADRDSVIEILCDYPLKREVKGLTRRVVDSTLDRFAASAAKSLPEIQSESPAEIPTEGVRRRQILSQSRRQTLASRRPPEHPAGVIPVIFPVFHKIPGKFPILSRTFPADFPNLRGAKSTKEVFLYATGNSQSSCSRIRLSAPDPQDLPHQQKCVVGGMP